MPERIGGIGCTCVDFGIVQENPEGQEGFQLGVSVDNFDKGNPCGRTGDSSWGRGLRRVLPRERDQGAWQSVSGAHVQEARLLGLVISAVGSCGGASVSLRGAGVGCSTKGDI